MIWGKCPVKNMSHFITSQKYVLRKNDGLKHVRRKNVVAPKLRPRFKARRDELIFNVLAPDVEVK